MPARDRYHEQVRHALIKDGWTITDDPLRLKWGKKDLYVDLGAEQLLTAEKGLHKIAVEVKSFVGQSEVADLEKALGQYILYCEILSTLQPDRQLYLAVSEETFANLFEEPIGQILLQRQRLQLMVFDPIVEVIRQWTPELPTEL